MTPACEQVLQRLGQPLSVELSAHAQSCAACMDVLAGYELLATLPAEKPLPSPSQRTQAAASALHSKAATELAKHPTSHSWRKEALLLVALNTLVALSGALALAHQAVASRAGSPLVLLLTALLAALLLIGPWIALSPRNRQSRTLILAGCVALGIALVLAGSGVGTEAGFIEGGVRCLATEVVLSLLPLATGVWVLTSTAFHPGRVAILGLSGGAAGLFALSIHCNNGLASHLLLFHVLPWLAVTAVALWARWALPSRSFAP